MTNLTFFDKCLMTLYVIDYKETSFENLEDVPNYTGEMATYFLTLIGIEFIFNFLRGKTILRCNDATISLAHALILQTLVVFFRGVQLVGYDWIYQYRLFEFDWRSPITWWAAAIAADFSYYWFHRMLHGHETDFTMYYLWKNSFNWRYVAEVGIAWTTHQVHHSSEDYNLTTALRQSAFQSFFSTGLYYPAALVGIPVPAIMAHIEFNLMYQFWIHCEAIPQLGPLEWVLNTPSHHKVHHGINKWCIDKNYGGVLIIWDRLFDTFEPYRGDEDIVYGLVDQPQTFEPIYLQLFYFRDIIKKAADQKTWTDSLRALCFGPGWSPGTPRLGDINQLPDETPQRQKFDPQIGAYLNTYAVAHFFLMIYLHQIFASYQLSLCWKMNLVIISFILFSLFNIGSFFDAKWWAALAESVRCVAFVLVMKEREISGDPIMDSILVAFFTVSAFVWTLESLKIVVGEPIIKKFD